MSETAFFGLPGVVKFCSKCVISNQRPSSTVEFQSNVDDAKATIYFDAAGVCDACRFAETKHNNIDWDQRRQDLSRLCDHFRRPSGYDVVVPGSGGKDSAYTAHILKYEYGMNPLTVTWAPHRYTDIGLRNFDNWIQIGGFDNILFTPNGRLHRLLTRLAFTNLLHPFQPFIVGQRTIGPMIAQKFDIPLVMYGENQAEYGNSSGENDDPKMRSQFYSRVDEATIRLGGLAIRDIQDDYGFATNDFEPYMGVDAELLMKSQVEVHYLSYYLKWDPQECYYYASTHTGFLANDERTEGSYSKYSSIDDKIDPFHYYTTLVKFGLGRASYDAAQEIRNGKITRSEGVALVRLYDKEFPRKYFDEFLDYISVDEETFRSTVDRFRSPHLWKREGDEWELRHAVWMGDSSNS